VSHFLRKNKEADSRHPLLGLFLLNILKLLNKINFFAYIAA